MTTPGNHPADGLSVAPSGIRAISGAQALLEAAHSNGIEVCFANPGTTEMPLVHALDDVTGIRPVLGLFEGVCTGAADGYARIADQAASTLLHLGPGLANGIANLHNARRARTPMLNIVGDHASWHVQYDAPLTSNIEALARTVSGWVHTSTSAAALAQDTADALAASNTFPRQAATLVVPLDFQHADVNAIPVPTIAKTTRDVVKGERVEAAARRIRSAGRVALLLGEGALGDRGQRAAASIQAATGAIIYCETFPAVAQRGGDLPDLDRLPYFPETAIKALAGADAVVLVGALEPVSYFGYEGIPALLAPAGSTIELSQPGEDGEQALIDLAAALGIQIAATGPTRPLPTVPMGNLTPAGVAAALTRLLPEGAIVSVEGGTCGYPFFTTSATAARHTSLTNTGGAIGQGLPVALGAAIAAPDRRVVALQSDGSAQYTIQSLWTMAREELDVVVLIASNSRYGVLQTELTRINARLSGPASAALTSLANPVIDWVSLARGYGVPGCTVSTGAELTEELGRALATSGPQLIEMKL